MARSRVASIWLLIAAPASLAGSEDLCVGLVTSRHERRTLGWETHTSPSSSEEMITRRVLLSFFTACGMDWGSEDPELEDIDLSN